MKDCLIIVAHPDDETIWMGGTIMAGDCKWTIVSLCRRNDEDRMPKFMKVCKFYGAEGIIGDLDDEKLEPLDEDYLDDFIMDIVPKKKFDKIYTHGKNGEYGHIRHIEIHKSVKRLFNKKKLIGEKLFFFDYVPSEIASSHDSELMIPIAREGADVYVRLNVDNLKKKIMLVRDVYGFSVGGFEVESSGVAEGFSLE